MLLISGVRLLDPPTLRRPKLKLLEVLELYSVLMEPRMQSMAVTQLVQSRERLTTGSEETKELEK
jgi:hypothetical protein